MISEFRIKKNEFNSNWELQIKVGKNYSVNKQTIFFKTKSKLLNFLENELEKINY